MGDTAIRSRVWTIEVCRSCDRLAQWPFCEHRPARAALDDARWTELVTVKEVRRHG
jgi:hypothetical protein